MSNSTDPKEHCVSISEMIQALSDIEDLKRPEQRYRENPQRERLEDLKKGRGVLSLNPELEDLTMFHGYIVDKDGIEYRVIVDPCLKGARTTCPETGQTEVAAGYWIAPMVYKAPDFSIPIVVDPLMKPGTFRLEQRKINEVCTRCGSPTTVYTVTEDEVKCSLCHKRELLEIGEEILNEE